MQIFMLFTPFILLDFSLMAFTYNSIVLVKEKENNFKKYFSNSPGQWVNPVVRWTDKKPWPYSCRVTHDRWWAITHWVVPGRKIFESDCEGEEHQSVLGLFYRSFEVGWGFQLEKLNIWLLTVFIFTEANRRVETTFRTKSLSYRLPDTLRTFWAAWPVPLQWSLCISAAIRLLPMQKRAQERGTERFRAMLPSAKIKSPEINKL